MPDQVEWFSRQQRIRHRGEVIDELRDAVAGGVGRGVGQARTAHVEGDDAAMARQCIAHAVPDRTVVGIPVYENDGGALPGSVIPRLRQARMQAHAA